MARSSTATIEKTMRVRVAATMPMTIARARRWSARPAAAMAMTTTLSPDSTTLMKTISR